jgi:hypothetical protein
MLKIWVKITRYLLIIGGFVAALFLFLGFIGLVSGENIQERLTGLGFMVFSFFLGVFIGLTGVAFEMQKTLESISSDIIKIRKNTEEK